MRTRCAVFSVFAYTLLALLSLGITGCSLFSPPTRTFVPPDTPPQFSAYSDAAAVITPWWAELDSVELTALVERALQRNTSIRETWARLRQSREFERMEKAALLPEFGYNGEMRHTRQNTEVGLTTTPQFSLALAGSYELDLWGRVRASVRAGELETLASVADLDAVRVSIAATVAQTWAALRTQKSLFPLARKQWRLARGQVELLHTRYLQGESNSKDLLEQEQEVAQLRTSMETIREEMARLQYELDVLCGDMPQIQSVQGSELIERAPRLELPQDLHGVGIPAQMLSQRPDVRAAAMRLYGADWMVAAKRAELLPALRLQADASLSSSHLNEMLDAWLLNLAAGVTGPVFEGGRRRAEIERARAVVDERLAAYRHTVLTAVKEVETALEQERRRRARLHEVERTIRAREQIWRQQRLRFLNGEDTMLNLMNAEQSLAGARQDRHQALYALYQARIALHRALGGRLAPMPGDTQG